MTYTKSNLNNGLMTKIWGPPMWTSLHCIAFGYPINPTIEQQKQYKNFFIHLQYVLPCSFCRISYGEFIYENDLVLDNKVFENRNNLCLWVYKLHQRVNKKLGVDYGVDYDDIVKRYESYRATCSPLKKGCIMPIGDKTVSFQNAKHIDCPIISYRLAKCFKSYAKLRNVPLEIEKYCDILLDSDKCDQKNIRNQKCNDIIQDMRIKGIPSIEQTGEFKDMPTIQELSLISMLSSTMSKEELINVTFRIGCKYFKKFKLTL